MAKTPLETVAHLMTRRWVCFVTRSGYHSGSACSPEEPHDEQYWACGYRWEFHISLTDSEYAKLVSEQIEGQS